MAFLSQHHTDVVPSCTCVRVLGSSELVSWPVDVAFTLNSSRSAANKNKTQNICSTVLSS